MDNIKFGALIYELRKEKAMTQKQLAEKLNVTDKAVSKWERGNGFPEITIIPELAKVFEISANELLGGQRNTKGHIELAEADEIVHETIQYIEKTNKIKSSNVFALISVVFLLSIFICLLCNYAISNRFDWSLYPAGGIIVAWCIIAPLILGKKHRFLFSLIGMTISTVPYFFLIEYLCPYKGWVVPLALPVTGISVVLLFVVIVLLVYTRINRYYAAALISFLTGVVLNLVVNSIVNRYVENSGTDISVVITAMSFALASVLFAAAGLRGRGKKEYLKN